MVHVTIGAIKVIAKGQTKNKSPSPTVVPKKTEASGQSGPSSFLTHLSIFLPMFQQTYSNSKSHSIGLHHKLILFSSNIYPTYMHKQWCYGKKNPVANINRVITFIDRLSNCMDKSVARQGN